MWPWIIGGSLFLVAAAAIWFAFQRPALWLELAKVAIMAGLPFVLKRKPPEEEEIWRDAIREGMGGTDQRRGGGPSSK